MVVPDISANDAWARLRHARECKGIALEDAARVTRISSEYLRALEEGHTDKLPSEAYAKGFLRSYGHFLGFSDNDLHDMQRLIDSSSIPESEVDEHRPALSASTSVAIPVKGRIVLLTVTFVVLAALSIYLVMPVKVPERLAGSPVMQRVRADKDMPAPNTAKNGVVAAKKDLMKEDAAGVMPFSRPVTPEKGVILRLKALEDGSLDVTIDDMITQHYDLKTGDLIEWKAEKAFSLDLENAGGVEAEFNGKLLGPFGAKGSPAHIVLKTDDGSGESTP
jgi:cytoskeleton protein RodZ